MNALIGIAGQLGCLAECSDIDACDAQASRAPHAKSATFRVRQITTIKHAPGFEAKRPRVMRRFRSMRSVLEAGCYRVEADARRESTNNVYLRGARVRPDDRGKKTSNS
mmetsp:Transcript_2759/g.8693  ORF Transcript_2759/g.8693 Transcript_2759/m.8693 type:complete len:109 (+) Transcript_2759:1-327(+)